MNKSELVNAIAEKSELSKADAKKALEAAIEAICEALKEGDKISLAGFATISSSLRPERQAKNPRTGETVTVPAKNVIKFKPGSELEKAVQ